MRPIGQEQRPGLLQGRDDSEWEIPGPILSTTDSPSGVIPFVENRRDCGSFTFKTSIVSIFQNRPLEAILSLGKPSCAAQPRYAGETAAMLALWRGGPTPEPWDRSRSLSLPL